MSLIIKIISKMMIMFVSTYLLLKLGERKRATNKHICALCLIGGLFCFVICFTGDFIIVCVRKCLLQLRLIRVWLHSNAYKFSKCSHRECLFCISICKITNGLRMREWYVLLPWNKLYQYKSNQRSYYISETALFYN